MRWGVRGCSVANNIIRRRLRRPGWPERRADRPEAMGTRTNSSGATCLLVVGPSRLPLRPLVTSTSSKPSNLSAPPPSLTPTLTLPRPLRFITRSPHPPSLPLQPSGQSRQQLRPEWRTCLIKSFNSTLVYLLDLAFFCSSSFSSSLMLYFNLSWLYSFFFPFRFSFFEKKKTYHKITYPSMG